MQFGGQSIFKNLSFSFSHGAVALVGTNGSGKSTLLSILAGMFAPQAGTIAVSGYNIANDSYRAKKILGYVPDESVAYDFMTGGEFLSMVSILRGHPYPSIADDLIANFDLRTHLDKRFGEMSLGTKKKFMLVSGLMSDSKVLLMDEPTNGIDADAKKFLISVITRDASHKLFFFSTHDQDLINESAASIFRLTQQDH